MTIPIQNSFQLLKDFDLSFPIPLHQLAGMDEAGRGAWMGPVTAGCVILPPDFDLVGINDSKKIKEDKRFELAMSIKEKAIAWGIGMVHNDEIERIGIQRANFLAFELALKHMKEQFGLEPSLILLDGTYKNVPIPTYQSIKKGDSLSAAIACASLLAKTARDEFVSTVCHEGFESFQFPKHKGYGTKAHQEAILMNGLTKWHRDSFCQKFLLKQTEKGGVI